MPFSGGIMPLALGKPIAASVMQAMLLRVWLRLPTMAGLMNFGVFGNAVTGRLDALGAK
ncbi:MAG: hypothetical protein ACRDNT_31160 [Streptosporangiaceae bacterium]